MEKNKLIAEYSLKDMTKPIGVSEYKLLEQIPNELKVACQALRNQREKYIVSRS